MVAIINPVDKAHKRIKIYIKQKLTLLTSICVSTLLSCYYPLHQMWITRRFQFSLELLTDNPH